MNKKLRKAIALGKELAGKKMKPCPACNGSELQQPKGK